MSSSFKRSHLTKNAKEQCSLFSVGHTQCLHRLKISNCGQQLPFKNVVFPEATHHMKVNWRLETTTGRRLCKNKFCRCCLFFVCAVVRHLRKRQQKMIFMLFSLQIIHVFLLMPTFHKCNVIYI